MAGRFAAWAASLEETTLSFAVGLPMATATRSTLLKKTLAERGLSHAEVAEALGVVPAEVAQWERKLATASVAQLRDLAVLTGVTVDELLGTERSLEEEAKGPYAPNPMLGVPYGTLSLRLGAYQTCYPIDFDARERLLRQLGALDIQEEGCENAWLGLMTLDNRWVFANPAYLHEVELVSDDDEAMPEFEHPEVYNALEHWDIEKEGLGPLLRERCHAILCLPDAEERLTAIRDVRILMSDGETSWHPLLETADTLGYYVLEMEAGSGIRGNRFIPVRSEGYYRERFVNLSNVALIEVPTNRYLRLAAREE
jgi:transcriptional regulator with XRE-family HTH domain